MKPRFLKVGSEKTKPRQRNKFFEKLIICLGLGFRQKTGFKTKPRQRNNFFEKLIYLLEFRFLPKKPALKLNLAS